MSTTRTTTQLDQVIAANRLNFDTMNGKQTQNVPLELIQINDRTSRCWRLQMFHTFSLSFSLHDRRISMRSLRCTRTFGFFRFYFITAKNVFSQSFLFFLFLFLFSHRIFLHKCFHSWHTESVFSRNMTGIFQSFVSLFHSLFTSLSLLFLNVFFFVVVSL